MDSPTEEINMSNQMGDMRPRPINAIDNTMLVGSLRGPITLVECPCTFSASGPDHDLIGEMFDNHECIHPDVPRVPPTAGEVWSDAAKHIFSVLGLISALYAFASLFHGDWTLWTN